MLVPSIQITNHTHCANLPTCWTKVIIEARKENNLDIVYPQPFKEIKNQASLCIFLQTFLSWEMEVVILQFQQIYMWKVHHVVTYLRHTTVLKPKDAGMVRVDIRPATVLFINCHACHNKNKKNFWPLDEAIQCFFCHWTHRNGIMAPLSTDFQSFNPIESFDVQGSSRDFGHINTIQYKYNKLNLC
jgi:hypothetical protein